MMFPICFAPRSVGCHALGVGMLDHATGLPKLPHFQNVSQGAHR